MKHPFSTLVNRRIDAAMDAGAFDDLPGAGKPLDLSKDPFDALMERGMAHEGVSAPIVTLRQEIATVQKQMQRAEGAERQRLMAALSDLQMRLALELETLKKQM